MELEETYYPCSEKKGADQLRSYCEADLRLCFRICKTMFCHDATQLTFEQFNKMFTSYVGPKNNRGIISKSRYFVNIIYKYLVHVHGPANKFKSLTENT